MTALGQENRDERRDQCEYERGGYGKPSQCRQRTCCDFADHEPSAHVPFGSPEQNIPKSRLDPVTHVTGRERFARARKNPPAAPDLNCGHNSAQFPPLSSPLRRAGGAEESPRRLSKVAGRGLLTVPHVMGTLARAQGGVGIK